MGKAMNETSDTRSARTMGELAEIRAIEQLKYAYFRHLDTKDWEAIADLFCDDIETSYDDGAISHKGSDELVAFLRQALGSPDLISMHNGHHPEIRLTSGDTAEGRWYLEDLVMTSDGSWRLHGTAVYEDTYRREDGRWRIATTGYSRIFEETIFEHDGERERSFRSRF